MPLVGTYEMLSEARKNHFAVGAFNVENMEMVQAVAEAAEALHSPVIIQTTPSTLRYASPEMFFAMVSAAARQMTVPAALHLDHGASFELAMRTIRAGYTSVMIDGSQLPFEDNITLSRKVVEACLPVGIPVEAELGKVGGKEDDTVSDRVAYTEPDEAFDFIARTGISSLAVAIGTAHGIYKGEPHLDMERLSMINAGSPIPLVLHGASGVPDEQIRDSIRRGICKVNFATELRIAFSDGIKAALAKDVKVFDPKKYAGAGRDAVRELVKSKMQVCGCAGKA